MCGDRWAKSVAQAAARNGKIPKYEKRPKPLQVSGVGKGAQAAPYDCVLPVALERPDGGEAVQGIVKIPTVTNSDLPGLWGCASLNKNWTVSTSLIKNWTTSLKVDYPDFGRPRGGRTTPPPPTHTHYWQNLRGSIPLHWPTRTSLTNHEGVWVEQNWLDSQAPNQRVLNHCQKTKKRRKKN